MKTNPRQIITLFSLAAAAAAFSGCAATRTQESTGQDIDDTAITAKVKAALLNDSQVKSTEISVTTFKGVVQLSGFVDNNDQKDAAENDAKNVPGVQSVKDNLTVK